MEIFNILHFVPIAEPEGICVGDLQAPFRRECSPVGSEMRGLDVSLAEG